MTNYDETTQSGADLAAALVDQLYCESCKYNQKGICTFCEGGETISMYLACYNAAIDWLNAEVQP